MFEYDKSSKWLIQHHGDSILRLAGIVGIERWRPLQAEVVQPRQLPDGLLEVTFEGKPQTDLFVLELATYPEARLDEQAASRYDSGLPRPPGRPGRHHADPAPQGKPERPRYTGIDQPWRVDPLEHPLESDPIVDDSRRELARLSRYRPRPVGFPSPSSMVLPRRFSGSVVPASTSKLMPWSGKTSWLSHRSWPGCDIMILDSFSSWEVVRP